MDMETQYFKNSYEQAMGDYVNARQKLDILNKELLEIIQTYSIDYRCGYNPDTQEFDIILALKQIIGEVKSPEKTFKYLKDLANYCNFYEHKDIDWHNEHQKKYFLKMNYISKEVEVCYETTQQHQGVVYFLNKDFLHKIIKILCEKNLWQEMFS